MRGHRHRAGAAGAYRSGHRRNGLGHLRRGLRADAPGREVAFHRAIGCVDERIARQNVCGEGSAEDRQRETGAEEADTGCWHPQLKRQRPGNRGIDNAGHRHQLRAGKACSGQPAELVRHVDVGLARQIAVVGRLRVAEGPGHWERRRGRRCAAEYNLVTIERRGAGGNRCVRVGCLTKAFQGRADPVRGLKLIDIAKTVGTQN